jgi:hypothetical protein
MDLCGVALFQNHRNAALSLTVYLSAILMWNIDMTEHTSNPNSSTDIEVIKLQPEMAPIDQIHSTEAILTPNAARAVTFGEDEGEFIALVEAVREFWQPKDVVERLLMTDFIHAEWELRRLRRLVPAAFAANRPFAVSKLEGFAEDRFCDSAFPTGTGTYQRALSDLAVKGHTLDVLDGLTLLMHTPAFESFDKRAAVLEVRRDSAWDKVERRRSASKTIASDAIGAEIGCR